MPHSFFERVRKFAQFRFRRRRINQLLRNKKRTFITFADGKIHTSSRLASEMARTQCFETILEYSPSALGPEFHEIHNQHLLHKRGYGFWCWKPWILRMELHKLRDGDFLIYADSGCSISPDPNSASSYESHFPVRLRSLISKFVDQPELELILPYPGTKWLTVEWTKADLLNYFGVLRNEKTLQTQMLEAGRLMFRRTPNVLQFVHEWCKVAARFDLISDLPSHTEEHPLFREHRHDQAIFNLLLNRLTWSFGLEDLLHATRYKH